MLASKYSLNFVALIAQVALDLKLDLLRRKAIAAGMVNRVAQRARTSFITSSDR